MTVADKPYNCEYCSAQCALEAMQMCPLPADECPVIQLLEQRVITDRRPTDLDPNFPSEFTYTNVPTADEMRYSTQVV